MSRAAGPARRPWPLLVLGCALGACGSSRTAPSGGVLQHHGNASRDGVYVDALLTRSAAAGMHLDPSFAAAPLVGPTYAQPLYLNGAGSRPDMLVVAAFSNHVYALDATTGQPLWDRMVAPRGVRSTDQCTAGPVGITGTPVIDGATRTIYLDAMTGVASDGGIVNKHMVFALDADTGNTRPGWPVDVDARARAGTVSFDSTVQNQRGALMLAGGTLFVPYGAFGGDCGSFHGWIVGISTADPTRVAAWAARVATGAGVWAPGGMSSDGTSIFFGTGNGVSSAATTWQDTEAIFRLPLSLVRSENSADYFAPTNWAALDATDGDLGGTAPVIVNAPGATPSALLVAFGKDGNGYLLDRANLGGIGGVIGSALLSRDGIINAPVAYTTPAGTYLALTDRGALCPPGEDGFATAVKITKTSPPTLAPAWCTLLIATQTRTAPIVSMTDAQGSNAIVWISASDDKLYGLDGDTGAQIFTSGTTTIPGVSRFVPPIIAKGRIFVASTTQVYAFTAK